jgi:hypothetical protein
LRLLDGFTVFSADDSSELHPLEILDPDKEEDSIKLAAHGTLLDPSPGGKKSLREVCVKLPHVTEWCIDYGEPPTLWLLTKSAWYKLLNPAPEYVELFASTRCKYDLCIRTAALLRADPLCSFEEGSPIILEPASGTEGRSYTDKELFRESGFILAQLTAAVEDEEEGEEESALSQVRI